MGPITEAIRRMMAGGERIGSAEATWNGVVLAESDHTVVVEGNHYFPHEDAHFDYLEPSSHHTVCPWKGAASYYDAVVDGERNRDAAWYYPSPSSAAAEIKDHVAFWHGVSVKSKHRR
jgi:uncharacterized protein (DUF427 family)